jgi:hypothetical protein
VFRNDATASAECGQGTGGSRRAVLVPGVWPCASPKLHGSADVAGGDVGRVLSVFADHVEELARLLGTLGAGIQTSLPGAKVPGRPNDQRSQYASLEVLKTSAGGAWAVGSADLLVFRV